MATQPASAPERLIKRPEVEGLTALSTSEIYRRIEAGTFPKPIKLGARAVAWLESEIQDWIAATVEAGREAQA